MQVLLAAQHRGALALDLCLHQVELRETRITESFTYVLFI